MFNTIFHGRPKVFQGDLCHALLRSYSVEPKKELCAFAISCKIKVFCILGRCW